MLLMTVNSHYPMFGQQRPTMVIAATCFCSVRNRVVFLVYWWILVCQHEVHCPVVGLAMEWMWDEAHPHLKRWCEHLILSQGIQAIIPSMKNLPKRVSLSIHTQNTLWFTSNGVHSLVQSLNIHSACIFSVDTTYHYCCSQSSEAVIRTVLTKKLNFKAQTKIKRTSDMCKLLTTEKI